MAKSVRIAVDIPLGLKQPLAEWMNPEHKVDDIGKFRCSLAVSADSVVEVTVDSGANWLKLNSGDTLKGGCFYGFDIYVRPGDLINFRTPSGGNRFLLLGRLDSIKDEG
jgi:hypothetical protein